MQLNSTRVCEPSGNWSFSYVHVAFDNSLSLVPLIKIKYILKVKLYPFCIGWQAIPKKVNLIVWLFGLKSNPLICPNVNLIPSFLSASSIENGGNSVQLPPFGVIVTSSENSLILISLVVLYISPDNSLIVFVSAAFSPVKLSDNILALLSVSFSLMFSDNSLIIFVLLVSISLVFSDN